MTAAKNRSLHTTLAARLLPLRKRTKTVARFLTSKRNRPELLFYLLATTTCTVATVGFGTMALASAGLVELPFAMQYAQHLSPADWGGAAASAFVADLTAAGYPLLFKPPVEPPAIPPPASTTE